MPIWKLEPVKPKDHNWRASKYDGPVFIRAPDELRARGMATSAFNIFAEHYGGSETPSQPWINSATCTHVEKSDFDEEGPDDILGPGRALSRAYPPPW